MAENDYFGLFGLEEGEIPSSSDMGREREEIVVKNKDDVLLNSKFCAICNSTAIKYTCPGCGVKSCSLDCVKRHKLEYECDGKRVKTAFVKLSQFTENNFYDDFTLLEEANNFIDAAGRQRRKIAMSLPELPKWLLKLRYEARMRGIRMKILPAGFTKRKANKTVFMYKENAIHWHIDWIFHGVGDGSKDLTVSDLRIPETSNIGEQLERFLSPKDVFEEFDKNRKLSKLAGVARTVLLKAEDGCYRVQESQTLKEALVGKTIVEYPTFIVLPKEHEKSYKILNDKVDQPPVAVVESSSEEESSDEASEQESPTKELSNEIV